MKTEMAGWQRHQLDYMKTICTGTPSLNIYRPDALPDAKNGVKALKATLLVPAGYLI